MVRKQYLSQVQVNDTYRIRIAVQRLHRVLFTGMTLAGAVVGPHDAVQSSVPGSARRRGQRSSSSGDRYYGAKGEPVGVQYRIYQCQSSRKYTHLV